MQALWFLLLGSTPKIEKFLRSVFYSPPIPFREFLIKAEMQVQAPKTV